MREKYENLNEVLGHRLERERESEYVRVRYGSVHEYIVSYSSCVRFNKEVGFHFVLV